MQEYKAAAGLGTQRLGLSTESSKECLSTAGLPQSQPRSCSRWSQSAGLANLAWDAALESLMMILPKTALQAKVPATRSMQRAERFININLGMRTPLNCISANTKHLIFCCRSHDSYTWYCPTIQLQKQLWRYRNMIMKTSIPPPSFLAEVPRGYQTEK